MRIARNDRRSAPAWTVQIETMCRYKLPTLVIVSYNGGPHRGDEVNE